MSTIMSPVTIIYTHLGNSVSLSDRDFVMHKYISKKASSKSQKKLYTMDEDDMVCC